MDFSKNSINIIANFSLKPIAGFLDVWTFIFYFLSFYFYNYYGFVLFLMGFDLGVLILGWGIY